MLVALSRAVGLWEPSAPSSRRRRRARSRSPTCRAFFSPRGVAAARGTKRAKSPRSLRLAIDARDPSPIGVVRELVLEALVELGEGWIPWPALERYLRIRSSHAGSHAPLPPLGRAQTRRSPSRRSKFAEPIEVARRIVHESLPALGMLDLGEEDTDDERDVDEPEAVETRTRCFASRRAARAPRGPHAVDRRRGEVPRHARASHRRAHAHRERARHRAVRRGRALRGDARSPRRAADARARSLRGARGGRPAHAHRGGRAAARVARATLAQASVVLGREHVRRRRAVSCGSTTRTFASCSARVARRASSSSIRRRRAVCSSRPGVDLDRLSRRCRALGIEVLYEGQVVRARSIPPGGSSTPPPPRITPSHGTAETRRRSSQIRIQGVRKKGE